MYSERPSYQELSDLQSELRGYRDAAAQLEYYRWRDASREKPEDCQDVVVQLDSGVNIVACYDECGDGWDILGFSDIVKWKYFL